MDGSLGTRERPMSDAVETKTPRQWAALVGAAGLVSSAIYFAGAVFHEHILADARQLITDHAFTATANRSQFFKELESDARGALGRISAMEQNCAVVQKQLSGIESRLDGLDHWRSECSQKMAGVQQYMARDSDDIRGLEQDVKGLYDLLRKGNK